MRVGVRSRKPDPARISRARAETNLIRQLAPDSVYQRSHHGNAAVAKVRAASLPSTLYVSVQVETAWPASGHIRASRRTLPISPSSKRSAIDYPYLGGLPTRVDPLDYYSRIGRATLPVSWWREAAIGLGWQCCLRPMKKRDTSRARNAAGQRPGESLFQLTFYDLDLRGFRQATGFDLAALHASRAADSA